MRFEMLRWIEAGGAIAYGFEASDLGEMIPWMERYTKRGGREMDLADASLYWLATETGVYSIMAPAAGALGELDPLGPDAVRGLGRRDQDREQREDEREAQGTAE